MYDIRLNNPVILHPTDFSEGSEVAFYHALKLALLKNTALYILHVNLHGANGAHWNEYPNVRETLIRWGVVGPVIQQDELFESAGVIVDKVEIRGDSVIDAVLRFEHIRQRGIDMLVTSTGARQGLPRWFQPSIAERLVREFSVPTLFVAQGTRQWVNGESGAIEIDNILVPVSEAVEPKPAIDAASVLFHLLGVRGTITPLHVGADYDFDTLGLKDNAFCYFRPIASTGDVVECITATANALNSGVIMMTTQGHDGLLDTIRGSMSERVLRNSPCTVMVIPTNPATTQT